MAASEHQEDNYFVRMKVVGIGRSGCNTINRMIEAGFLGVDFVAIDTDVHTLLQSKAATRLRIGGKLTRGLGTGGKVETGRKAAGEAASQLYNLFLGSDIVFITAGMGGGTGTGVASVLAQIARRTGALSIAVVTSPFPFEGLKRNQTAQQGIANLHEQVDTLIVVPNERLLQFVDKGLSLEDAYQAADDVLRQSVQSLAELVKQDFPYVRSAMAGGLTAYLAVGRASGKGRARQAADKALTNLLLDVTLQEARQVLFYINGGSNLTLAEIDEAVGIIRETAHPEADITFRSTVDSQMGEEICIYLLATGYEVSNELRQTAANEPEQGESSIAEPIVPPTPVETPAVPDSGLPSFLRGRSKPVAQPVKESPPGVVEEVPVSTEPPTTPASGVKPRRTRRNKR